MSWAHPHLQKSCFAIMYFSTIIILYVSISPLADHSCNHAVMSAIFPVLALPHICSKVRISPLDICFNSPCLSCGLVLPLVVTEVLFAEVLFAAKMALIHATKSGPCSVAPPVATCPPDLMRVGKHRAVFPLSHRHSGMLDAAKSAIPTK